MSIDILNRQEFVVNLSQLTNQLARCKKSVTFAIDGEWGVGKSFVLDMYEKKLSQIQCPEKARDKYFIIRYNCWKYDYYEEPLIAIVANIIEAIERKTKLFPNDKTQSKVLGVLKAIGITLLSMTTGAVKEKTGLDFKQAFDVVQTGVIDGERIYDRKHKYDVYLGFNKTMERLQKSLTEIAKDYTILFLVDELDRCLPEYAIKVLERLHHLTENLSNIITVVAIDKNQLKGSIKNTLGFDKVELYLKKFINFEVKLNIGLVSEKFVEKYADYLELFASSLWEIEENIEEFLQEVFKGIDARTQTRIMDKAFLIHTLLYNEPKDYVFMCLELLILILNTCYGSRKIFTSWLKTYVNIVESRETAIPFDRFFNAKLEQMPNVMQPAISNYFDFRTIIDNTHSLYGMIMYCWYRLFFNERGDDRIIITNKSTRDYFKKNIDDLGPFIMLAQIIQ